MCRGVPLCYLANRLGILIVVDLVSKNWNTHYSNLLQWIEYVNLSNYSRKKQVYGGLNDRGMPVV